ncbi:MAG: 9-O-acetylesterase, partial [Bacteroidales bacterium]|nr:9-O-acetylesterase [Bacteroidales bacterium]
FGREIYKRLKVPIGLIFSAWGGTPAEAWTSREYIDKIPYFHGSSGHADPEAFHQKKLETYKKKQQQWLDQLNFSPGDATPGWAMPAFDDGQWSEIPVPSNWETTSIGHFEGTVTYRLEFKVPKKWIDQVNTLSLGPIDEMDITYLNGKLVGKQLSVYGWATPRVYEIPLGLLKHKGNILAVKVANTSGIGGINGKKSDLRIQPENSKKTGQSLAGAWRAKKSEAFDSIAPMPGCSNCALFQTPTTLYNGMIYPIIPYRIKGAIWYQGESNRYDGELYKKIFPNMIKNWRHDWGLGDFPFYFVQIAPFTYRDHYSTGLLREAQTYTYQHVPHTGMVVTMDIGSLKTIHPPNKEAVGFRLAQWALAKDYGMKNLYYSGPMYRGYQKEGSKIRIYFSHFCGGLWSPDDTLSCFRIAGADRVFHKAKAVIDKITVVVWSDEIPDPVAIRFGWESTDIPNLFNMSRLPAWPFRTDNWEIKRVK